MILIPAWIISIFLFAAVVALLISPAPRLLRYPVSVSLGYFAFIYTFVNLNPDATTIDERAIVVRIGLLLLSLTIIGSCVIWRVLWKR